MSNKVFVENKEDLQIESAAFTDRGQQRMVNEDVVFNQTGQTYRNPKSTGLFLVCDGMGGHKAGKVASQLAVGTVMAELANLLFPVNSVANGDYTPLSHSTIRQFVKVTIQAANSEIRQYAYNHPREAGNMGTTMTMALVYGDCVHIANVGDSRAYVWRSGQLTQITQDHSVAAELVRMGKIEQQTEIAKHAQRSILLRALGINEEVKVDLFDWKLQSGDKLLLCSDGLWKAFPDSTELAEWLALDIKPDKLCQQLVDEANKRDGSDNISAVVVSINKASNWQQQIVDSVANMFHKFVAPVS